MAKERMLTLDGKEVAESKLPPNCYCIHGKWYTESGLPPELSAYKRLWEEARKQTVEQKKKPTTTQTQETDPANTATSVSK
jgi:hypothetical protein